MTGYVAIAGLGPGDEVLWTDEVRAVLSDATDAIGYFPYVARVPDRDGLIKHGSDNRVEVDRARHALELAARGHKVVVVSSGDPGVFAMAAAVYEAVDEGDPAWRNLEIRVLPGITAMLAAAARVGAPLGHDFCAINLSNNLKPWDVVEKRLRLAAEGDFAMAFYNPNSKSRPWQFGRTLEVLRETRPGDLPIIFARAVSTPEEAINIVALKDAVPEMADMRTMVLVGTTQTRLIARDGQAPIVYTPRKLGQG